MPFAVLSGILAAFAAPLLFRWLGRWAVLLLALLPLSLLAYCLYLLPMVLQGQVLLQEWVWLPELGVNLSFRVDGLGLLFCLLVTFFGFLIMVYAGEYLKESPLIGRFYFYLTLFMTGMLGLVTADNIFCLFLFWEMTSISSYLLIGFDHNAEQARVSAWQALLVTGAGGLAMFGGLLLLGHLSGSYTFSGLLSTDQNISAHFLYLPATALILLGCFTKSAQFPFHFWLPNAMAAPTPVSAYLHSATMVKAGVYLLARLTPILGGTEVWQYSLLVAGGCTAVLGAWLALQHIDLKAILAYTTISALGLLVLLLGWGNTLSYKAMLVFLVAHALYKGTLFLVAGTIDHSTGTRNLNELHLLGPRLKPLSWSAGLAALSMAGVLPFVGFVGKELLYEATLHTPALFGVAFVTGLAFVAVALLFGFRIFWQKNMTPTAVPHPPGPSLYLPPLVLALVGLLLGLSLAYSVNPLLSVAYTNLQPGAAPEVKLALWHGLTPVLGLSLLTLFLGFIMFRNLGKLHQVVPALNRFYAHGPNALYHLTFSGFLHRAKQLTGTLVNGLLRSYIVMIVFFFCSLLLWVLWRDAPLVDLTDRMYLLQQVRLYELVLLGLVIAALIYLLGTRSRLTSIVVMGLVGYSAALFYILFGAPDVAATQLLIETLTVVIFVLLLHKLPAFMYLSHQFKKYKFIALSVFFGSVMTYVMLLVQDHAVDSKLKAYYNQASLVQAHGRNIVNVILVDFRALDTLGEITVLAVAALGIFALLRLRPEKKGGNQP